MTLFRSEYEIPPMFRTKDGWAGLQFAWLYPEKLLPRELERFSQMPRGRPKKSSTEADQFLEALIFVSVAADDKKEADFYKQHVILKNRMAIAFDGQISAGHPIIEDLEICPHLARLKKAIASSGKSLAITQTPAQQLSVKGESVRAVIPCIPMGDMHRSAPDAPYSGDFEWFKAGFKACNTLASENGRRVIEASVLLNANTMTSSNGHAIMQVWHGVDLPPEIVLPKVFTAAVAKQSKKITGFGFSWATQEPYIPSTFTVWFEGGAWIKTICYADRWPQIDQMLNIETAPEAVPVKMFEAIETVKDFNDNGFVKFSTDKVTSHASDEQGAQFDCKGLKGGKSFDGKLIMQIAPYVETIDLVAHKTAMMFFGKAENMSVRGIVSGIYSNEPHPDQTSPMTVVAEAFEHEDEEIAGDYNAD